MWIWRSGQCHNYGYESEGRDNVIILYGCESEGHVNVINCTCICEFVGHVNFIIIDVNLKVMTISNLWMWIWRSWHCHKYRCESEGHVNVIILYWCESEGHVNAILLYGCESEGDVTFIIIDVNLKVMSMS